MDLKEHSLAGCAPHPAIPAAHSAAVSLRTSRAPNFAATVCVTAPTAPQRGVKTAQAVRADRWHAGLLTQATHQRVHELPTARPPA